MGKKKLFATLPIISNFKLYKCPNFYFTTQLPDFQLPNVARFGYGVVFVWGSLPPHTKTTPKHNLAKLGNWKLKNPEFPISQFGKWAWEGPPHPTPTENHAKTKPRPKLPKSFLTHPTPPPNLEVGWGVKGAPSQGTSDPVSCSWYQGLDTRILVPVARVLSISQ